MSKYIEVPEEKRQGYTIRDRRGIDEKDTPCRVCGSSVEHTTVYSQPTMECIKYLRGEIARLSQK